ncbi:SRPBCC family protein [Tamlana sp. 2_MG-2023]|uniref:SRPBCC family protein n=1 Tax=unclassified Tamlana TaxID=2614803 RepID=UPI0026E1FC69|nr:MULTISPECIES: SRPBCC family protein [unclassified Tamlana]MDO6758822.1 SRPBCC family protein [Tamlana sp. 2_MG-2023]MDO6789521.1 SRPBCC family protein [Tamlana sp. 1_MG-2023]
MATILLESEINSDIKTCFDLSRNITILKESLKRTNETPIAGKTSGLIEKGEWISWEANHFGVAQHLTTKIVAFDRPNYFVNEMVLGVFKSYRHEHIFEEINGITLMTHRFIFESPYGILGKLVDWLFLKRYITKLLKSRIKTLKFIAESESADDYTSPYLAI